MHYTYILKSISNSSQTYIGHTSNLKQRLINHNSGKSSHTNKFKPWQLDFYCAFTSKEKAINIDEGNYELAIKLLDSALNANFEDEVKIDEDCRIKLIINLANAHRLNKNLKTVQSYLQGDAWKQNPLCHPAQQAILGNYEIAGKIMKDEVRNGLMPDDYLNYPLFIGFRETQYFVEAYKVIFQKDPLIQERTVLKEMVGLLTLNLLLSN
jgi:putative endonuclease